MGYGIPGLVTIAEPPLQSREVCVVLDGSGRLLELHARPPLEAESDRPPIDWAALFALAGLEKTTFTRDGEVAPRRDPGAFAEKRHAWLGRRAGWPDRPVRVEAAERGGQVVFFWVGDEATGTRALLSDVPTDLGTRLSEWVYSFLRLAAVTVGGWLAWRNVRRGVANLPGALRLVLVGAGASLFCWLFMAHHVAPLGDEWAILAAAAGGAVLSSLMMGLIYLALEPSVRRLHPEWVISWNRLLSGRFRDPLVGRDFLVGALFGVVWVILIPVRRTFLPEALGQPFAPYAVWMPALTFNPLGPLCSEVWFQLFFQLLEFFLLVFVYLLSGRLSIAVILCVVFWTVRGSLYLGEPLSPLSLGMAALGAGLFLFTLLRFGLLAFVSLGLFGYTLTDMPVTLDSQAPYALTSFFTLAALGGLAVFAFRNATAEGDRLPELSAGRG
jgi:hypothetical protein